uniref:Uncharacterized protein n=1 Tax=Romanomermis culicivorax TaxID=13658 RepID=A0A915KD86_ROMCU
MIDVSKASLYISLAEYWLAKLKSMINSSIAWHTGEQMTLQRSRRFCHVTRVVLEGVLAAGGRRARAGRQTCSKATNRDGRRNGCRCVIVYINLRRASKVTNKIIQKKHKEGRASKKIYNEKT